MYLNDLNSAQHRVSKLNKILADTFNHEVDLSSMNYESLNRMLTTTNAKLLAIKESDLTYWENPQYNKLGLIQHQIKTYITELAPARSDGKRMKTKESTIMEADLDQAEVLLAAQELVDEMQKMVEDVAEMQVQKLMPIVDAMKQQVGFEVAEVYNNAADGALGALLDQMKQAKDALENATLTARGEQPAASAPTDMGMDDAAMDPQAPMDGAQNMDMDADEFAGDEASAGEENPVGRELKGESAIANIEKGALAEKKFLESKGKLFKMVESGQMSQEHFINVINELDFKSFVSGDNYMKLMKKAQAPKPGKPGVLDDPTTKLPQISKDYEPKPMGGYSNDPDARRRQGGGEIPKRPGDRGFTPGVQEPEIRLKNQRGFTPGVQEPATKLQNKRGFTPGVQEPATKLQNKRGFTPGQTFGRNSSVKPLPKPKSYTLGKSWSSV